jgi:hypothetical protein
MQTIPTLLPTRLARPVGDGKDLPPDVIDYIERRQACEHFLGEDPYDEERRRFLKLRIRRTRSGMNEQGDAARELHRDDPAVQNALEPYQERIVLESR